jgi:hypothetical protein
MSQQFPSPNQSERVDVGGKRMDTILEFIGRLILALILLIVLLPIIWIISSPFILIGAAIMPGPYYRNLNHGFRSVSQIWIDWGILLFP